ncbi:MAG: chlorite dismutase family protein [Caldilineaceae bacterium]|nr:chlorite dismutase family protein [Caldilineaceae bacterium]
MRNEKLATEKAEQNRHAESQDGNDDAELVNVYELGRSPDGEVIRSTRRLFMRFQAFGDCMSAQRLIQALEEAQLEETPLPATLYLDVNDPRGVGLIAFSEDADFFVTTLRDFLLRPPFSELTPKPEYTMFGRTYSIGYEPDLDETLIHRPIRNTRNPDMPWAVWYPLRRAGSFEQLSAQEQRTILAEHGGIGRAYGRAGLGTDIRLASFGLDKNDNDFVVALVGPELFPLSAIVQRMRKTKQTSLYMEKMGPFFVGKAIWQSKNESRKEK